MPNKGLHSFAIKYFKGALFDLDGVITNTTKIHAKSWKMMFDEFLENYGKKTGKSFELLDIETDYPNYIDGKFRYDGVRSFLKSRGIDLPEGNDDDRFEHETIKGLGNWKNEIFSELLGKEPIRVYQENIDKIVEWRKLGIKTAIISSSKNCATILEKTKLNSLFDVRIDGVISQRLNLKGKPEPDIFLEGTRELGLKPEECIVFEDTISGVQAGNEGNFGLVIGITTTNDKDTLIKNGADMAVNNLSELQDQQLNSHHFPDVLTDALQIKDWESLLKDKKPVIFLDYDGTLTPIVSDPDKAILPESTREILEALSENLVVGIISGRDWNNVKSLVRLETIYYAGSHGFDIGGPGNLHMELEEARELLPQFEKVEKSLKAQTADLKGVHVERKRFAIAVHYRNASEHILPGLKTIVDQTISHYDDLKLGGGKKIFEIKPNVDWDKGKAMKWLLENLGLKSPDILPIFIGDDLTDEDAFRILINEGLSILVGDHGERTFANYHLKDAKEVEQFLDKILSKIKAYP